MGDNGSDGMVDLQDASLEGLDNRAKISVLEMEIETRRGLVAGLKDVILKQNDQFTALDEETAQLKAQLKGHRAAIEAASAVKGSPDDATLALLRELEEKRRTQFDLSRSLARTREATQQTRTAKETNERSLLSFSVSFSHSCR